MQDLHGLFGHFMPDPPFWHPAQRNNKERSVCTMKAAILRSYNAPISCLACNEGCGDV